MRGVTGGRAPFDVLDAAAATFGRRRASTAPMARSRGCLRGGTTRRPRAGATPCGTCPSEAPRERPTSRARYVPARPRNPPATDGCEANSCPRTSTSGSSGARRSWTRSTSSTGRTPGSRRGSAPGRRGPSGPSASSCGGLIVRRRGPSSGRTSSRRSGPSRTLLNFGALHPVEAERWRVFLDSVPRRRPRGDARVHEGGMEALRAASLPTRRT